MRPLHLGVGWEGWRCGQTVGTVLPAVSSFLSVTSMWWLRARPLTRPVPSPPLPLSTISLRIPLPFLNPKIDISFGMLSPRRHQNVLDTRPPIHREMAQQTLNRDAFKKRISVLAVSVPVEKASLFLKSQELRGCVLEIRWLSQLADLWTPQVNHQHTKNKECRPRPLKSGQETDLVPGSGVWSVSTIPCPLYTGCGLTNCLKQADLSEPAQKFLKSHNVATTTHGVNLDYDFWSAGEIACTLGKLVLMLTGTGCTRDR
jgi:hypothetical protein